ncbi:hypothetical protein [Beijerinckia indica]|uniref:Uncharacterized protein n=1 Tax=Beijerinckia indica subsp. indica (strain ATCC 9039 / DSM 1715 / NCIMB 8712) TaxID=395963 RepID=B2IDZ9_BEII9|nr:hypothetical protein [Beijerinckia indica]ACB96930.1 hypothetical protein Bind_3373 [Beijerinckia indica subsp. indica ATCC 9039]
MFNFLLLMALGIAGVVYMGPKIKAYQASIGVLDALEKPGLTIITKIRLRLIGIKTIIIGYVAVLVGSLPDFIGGIVDFVPQIHPFIEQMDLSVWFSPHTAASINNLFYIAMIGTRVLGMLVIAKGLPGEKEGMS